MFGKNFFSEIAFVQEELVISLYAKIGSFILKNE